MAPKKTWQEDFDVQLAPLTESNPCFYAFYRLDSKSSLGYEFILFSFISETAAVRDKMVYASTLSAVKVGRKKFEILKIFQASFWRWLYFEGIYHQLGERPDMEGSSGANAARSRRRATNGSRKDERRNQATGEYLRHDKERNCSWSYVSAFPETLFEDFFRFPVTSEAIAALKEFAAGKVDYVRLAIDVKQEHICLEQTDNFAGSTTMFSGAVSTTSPNYHLFKFKYDHNGKAHKKDCFVYSIPSEVTVPIKVNQYAANLDIKKCRKKCYTRLARLLS